MMQRVKFWISRTQKSDFFKNIRITGAGVAITTALGFFTSPIISRIFSPEAYGTAGLYTSTIAILSTISTLMYPTALVVVRPKRDLYHLIAALKWLFVFSFVFLFLSIFLFKAQIQYLLGDQSSGFWLYLLPVGLLAGQIINLTGSLNVRSKQFKTNAKAQVTNGLSGKLGTVIFGWLAKGHYMVIILMDLISVVPVLLVQKKQDLLRILKIKISWQSLLFTLRKYKDYPLYMLPGNFISTLSIRAPFYIFSSLYSIKLAGAFLFANGIIQIPLKIISNSFTPVFLQKSNDLYHADKIKLGQLTKATNYSLFFIGLLPFSLLTVFGKEIFIFVFSAKWDTAGLIIQYLALYYLFRLASSPLSGLYRVANQEKKSFITQVVLFTGRILPLAIGLYYFDLETGLLLLAIGSVIGYLFHFWQMTRIAGISFWKPSIIQLSLFASLVFIFYSLKFLL